MTTAKNSWVVGCTQTPAKWVFVTIGSDGMACSGVHICSTSRTRRARPLWEWSFWRTARYYAFEVRHSSRNKFHLSAVTECERDLWADLIQDRTGQVNGVVVKDSYKPLLQSSSSDSGQMMLQNILKLNCIFKLCSRIEAY